MYLTAQTTYACFYYVILQFIVYYIKFFDTNFQLYQYVHLVTNLSPPVLVTGNFQ